MGIAFFSFRPLFEPINRLLVGPKITLLAHSHARIGHFDGIFLIRPVLDNGWETDVKVAINIIVDSLRDWKRGVKIDEEPELLVVDIKLWFIPELYSVLLLNNFLMFRIADLDR